MTGNSEVVSGIAAFPGEVGFAPPRRPAGLAGPGAVAIALLRARHLIARLRDRRHGPRRDDDRPSPPPAGADGGDIWNDPALWMLMIH